MKFSPLVYNHSVKSMKIKRKVRDSNPRDVISVNEFSRFAH